MRSVVLLMCCFLAVVGAFAQGGDKPVLSTSTKAYLHNLSKSATDLPLNPTNYVFNRGNDGRIYTSTLIQAHDDLDAAALNAWGAQVGTEAGDVWTVKVPIDQVTEFVELPGIAYIEMDQPIAATMDSARTKTNTDLVHQGLDLPQAYFGEGIVVGIIDYGFDYTHPNFYDASLTDYRVKRVWEQKNTEGTQPALFAYGSEFADSLSIVTQGHDASVNTSHGTHVGGTAGGSGAGSENTETFRGMAPMSDLVFVAVDTEDELWLSTGKADFLDGVHYIFDYADQVGKPAVVNISWGGYVGPRDGTGLFSQGINNLTGEGRILVKSAGNSGRDNLHLFQAFSEEENEVNSFVQFHGTPEVQYTNMDLWGEPGESFCVKFTLYDGSQSAAVSEVYCTDGEVYDIQLPGSEGGTCEITLTSEVAQWANGKPHIFAEITNETADRLLVTISATSGSVHAWQGHVSGNRGYASEFENFVYNWAVDGDDEYLTGDMASTGSVIAVGAYNSKLSYTNLAGNLVDYAPTGYVIDDLSRFSSPGPTADGRLKPEVTAPGTWVASSIANHDESYQPGGDSYNVVVSEYVSPINGETYRFALSAGTSMSSPCVAGIVALLLEQDPTLEAYQLREVFQNTSILDDFTGDIPAEGDYEWGWGKVNAHAAIQYVIDGVGIDRRESASGFNVFPNPADDEFTVRFDAQTPQALDLILTDLNGRIIAQETWRVVSGTNTRTIALEDAPAGVYLVRLHGAAEHGVVRLVKR